MDHDNINRAEFSEYSRRIDDHNKRQDRRLEIIEGKVEQIGELTLAIQKLADNMDKFSEAQTETSARLKAIEDAPAETIKTVRAAVLSAIGGAVAAAVVAGIISIIGG